MATRIHTEQSAERVSRLIRALHLVGRDPDRNPRARVNLTYPVHDAIELCRERFKRHGVSFSAFIPHGAALTLMCRPAQITEALRHLLYNACDAAATRSRSWVEMRVTELPTSIEIRVMDSGPGIPRGLWRRLREPFFTTKKFQSPIGLENGQGFGLGLSVARYVAHSHGGRLALVASAASTTFVLALPRN